MPPQILALVLSLVEVAIQEEPAIASQLQSLFSNPNPTPADWEALRAQVLAKTYADYVPASALGSTTPKPVHPGVTAADASPKAPISNPGAKNS